ncbi:MAG: NAD-binding protein [Nitriliruptorales bacterium]|nr:NAD-binding protein [Nitriliruptorales bacterium]
MNNAVGVVGLGQMGGAMARHLLTAGFDVVGFDVAATPRAAFGEHGGALVDSPQAVAEAADRVITSLPSVAALDAVVNDPDGLLAAGRRVTVIETSTLPLDVKQRNHDAAQAAGVTLLDCPLSGTGAQAQTGDLVVFASGDDAEIDRCVEIFEGFSRAHFRLGEFGSGSKMKFIANHLVTIHNVAAAEALVLGMKAGLDPARVLEVVSSGAGTSRMLEIRGPSMVENRYTAAGMAGSTFQKDIRIIGDFAKSLACPVPLFSASSEVHLAAVAQGFGDVDTAAVCAVLERLAGLDR